MSRIYVPEVVQTAQNSVHLMGYLISYWTAHDATLTSIEDMMAHSMLMHMIYSRDTGMAHLMGFQLPYIEKVI